MSVKLMCSAAGKYTSRFQPVDAVQNAAQSSLYRWLKAARRHQPPSTTRW
ncbi:hypothetical protein [Amycolatopsis japonica]|nr:hypothetical protein [Amycolatopsis japonica]